METPDTDPIVRTYGPDPAEFVVIVPDEDRFVRAVDLSEAPLEFGVRTVVVGTDGEYDPAAVSDGLPGVTVGDHHDPPEPLAFFDRSHFDALNRSASLPVAQAIDVHGVDPEAVFGPGIAPTEHGLVHLEIGPEDAEAFVLSVLESVGALPGESRSPDGFYVLADAVAGDESATALVENFERVDLGTVFAEVDGTRLVANWPFVPVLFGDCGTDGIVGFRGSGVGTTAAEARVGLRPDTVETEE